MTCIANKSNQKGFHYAQAWLAVPLVILWAFAIRIIRDKGRIMNRFIDDKLDSSSDYCIMMEGLPAGNYG